MDRGYFDVLAESSAEKGMLHGELFHFALYRYSSGPAFALSDTSQPGTVYRFTFFLGFMQSTPHLSTTP